MFNPVAPPWYVALSLIAALAAVAWFFARWPESTDPWAKPAGRTHRHRTGDIATPYRLRTWDELIAENEAAIMPVISAPPAPAPVFDPLNHDTTTLAEVEKFLATLVITENTRELATVR